MILVDTNVAIDVLNPASDHHAWSMDAWDALPFDALFFDHIIVAELAVGARSPVELERMIAVLGIAVDPLDDQIAFCAGQAFKLWVKNGGRRGALLPDFIIGAHAAVRGARILTRDPRRFRSYFPDVPLITPKGDHD